MAALPSRLSARMASTMCQCLLSTPQVFLLVLIFLSRTLEMNLRHQVDQHLRQAEDMNIPPLAIWLATNCQCQAKTYNTLSNACNSSQQLLTTASEEHLSSTSTSWLSSGSTSAKMRPESRNGSRLLARLATRLWYAAEVPVITKQKTRVVVHHLPVEVEALEAMETLAEAMVA